MEKISGNWRGLDHLHKSKVSDLEEKLKLQEEMERLRLLYANKARDYNNFIKNSRNDVSGREFGDNLQAVLDMEGKLHHSDDKYKQESNTHLAELEDLWNKLQGLGVTDNRYSSVTFPDLVALNNHLLEDLEHRRRDYEVEKQRQLDMEAKRKEFADKANHFVEHLNLRKNEIDSHNSEPDPRTLIDKISHIHNNGQPETEALDSLLELANEMDHMKITSNPHTKHTMPSLTLLNKGFVNEVRLKIQSLNDEDRLKEEYRRRSTKLLEDVSNTFPTLARQFDNTLDGAKRAFVEWNNYKSGLSAELVLDKENIVSIKSKIDNLLEKYHRPAFVPAEGIREEDIHSAIHKLQEEEHLIDKIVREELARQERIAKNLSLYNSNFQELESFIQEKVTSLTTFEAVNTLNDASKLLRFLGYSQVDIENRAGQLEQIEELTHKLEEENYKEKEHIKQRTNEIKERFHGLAELREKKNAYINEHLADQQKKGKSEITIR